MKKYYNRFLHQLVGDAGIRYHRAIHPSDLLDTDFSIIRE